MVDIPFYIFKGHDIIIIIIYSLRGFLFTSNFADDLSLEFERQQVASSLQDSSQYPGRSQ